MIEIINDYKNSSVTLRDLSQKYALSIRDVFYILDENIGLRPWISESEYSNKFGAELVSEFHSGNTKKVSKEYGVSDVALRRFLKNSGVNTRPKRKYLVDDNYFNNIDCEEKAYFLGLLSADGCNMPKISRVTIELQSKDKEILVKLSNLLQPDRPVIDIPKRLNRINTQPTSRLTIYSQQVSKDLEKHGIVENKTHYLVFPEWISPELVRHYVRGNFDGDGTAKQAISFCGAHSFCLGLKNVLMSELNIDCIIRSNKKCLQRGNFISRLEIIGRPSMRKFAEWIYTDSIIYMERKFQESQRWLNYEPRKKQTKEERRIKNLECSKICRERRKLKNTNQPLSTELAKTISPYEDGKIQMLAQSQNLRQQDSH